MQMEIDLSDEQYFEANRLFYLNTTRKRRWNFWPIWYGYPILGIVFLVGCGSSTPSPSTPTVPKLGPPSGSEILYQASGADNGLTLFSVDPASGEVGTATWA